MTRTRNEPGTVTASGRPYTATAKNTAPTGPAGTGTAPNASPKSAEKPTHLASTCTTRNGRSAKPNTSGRCVSSKSRRRSTGWSTDSSSSHEAATEAAEPVVENDGRRTHPAAHLERMGASAGVNVEGGTVGPLHPGEKA